MPGSPTRRQLLRRVPAAAGGALGAAWRARRVRAPGGRRERRRGRERGRGRGFDPARDAFGFRNWSSAVPTYPGHDHDAVSAAEVRRFVRSGWPDALRRTLGVALGPDAEALVASIARQLYVSANRRSASDGHCYGMTYAAQAYFERPSTVPLGRSTASEFAHPEAPVDEERSPVGRDVDVYQNLQLLDPNAWLGRRGLFAPGQIDLAASVRNVRAVIERFGTAGATLLNTTTLGTHQVLLYDAAREGGRTRLAVYDPNYAARHYREEGPRHLEVVHEGTGAWMVPYEGYDSFVFNERGRVIAARGRADAVPGLDVDPDALAERALRPVTFTVEGESAEVVVLDPEGRRVRREHAACEAPDRTPACAMRCRYGGTPGDYRVAVLGRGGGEYTLRVDAATPSGELLRAEASDVVAPGEAHHYRAQVPRSTAGRGSLRRVRPGVGVSSSLLVAGSLVGAGAGAVAAARRRSRSSESSVVGEDAADGAGAGSDRPDRGRRGDACASRPRERS